MKTNKYTGLDPHIVAVIGREVKKLIGRYGFTASDVPDIEQELHLKVWRSLKGLDEAILEAAVCQIVKHAMIDLLRRQERACRDWRQVAFSMNDFVPDSDDENECISDLMDLAKAFDVAFGRPASWPERREMSMDLDDALANLPCELRDMAEKLDACSGNLSEAARDLGISRKMARIRLTRLQHAMAWLRDA